MSKSPKLNLNLTAEADGTKTFLDFRKELAGDESTSNMMILDKEVGSLKEKMAQYESTGLTWGMLKNGLSSKS